MLGLIKKDFLLIKSNLKIIIIVFVLYLILAIEGIMNVANIIAFLDILLISNTFSYDDFNHWNSYAITLPDGRRNVVKAKYVTSIILTFILFIAFLGISIGITTFSSNKIETEETVSPLVESLFSIMLFLSLLHPLIFKFGSTKGKIIFAVLICGIVEIVSLANRFISMNTIVKITNKLEDCSLMSVSIFFIILLFISYLISNKIYQNKEF